MMSVTDWIGFGAVVGVAVAFLCLLLWYGGRSRGAEPRALGVAMVKVIGSIAGAVGIGAAGRAAVGGPVADVGTHSGRPLGLWLAPMRAHETAVVAVAMLLMALLFMYALSVVRSVVQGPLLDDGGSESDSPGGGAED
jgi:hypothetical protein